ncbi:GATA transcription factor [Striga asiatica]|uniref:GATA transcription factor n=1 Tax=Striga asiatica TaxID=4170 RepID=A0A5A7R0R3_STRAF|nr:GATA transcription factor [Striga asiatica]
MAVELCGTRWGIEGDLNITTVKWVCDVSGVQEKSSANIKDLLYTLFFVFSSFWPSQKSIHIQKEDCVNKSIARGKMGSDEIDCGNLFDQIDDLIEFPPESECDDGDLVGSGDCKDFFPSWINEALPDSDPFLPSDLSAELSVPYEDIAQLEWLSTFMEDSFSGRGLTLPKNETSSPVSVLESSSSSSSSSIGKTGPPLSPNHRSPQRARSKRPRRPAIQLIISPSSSSATHSPQIFSEPDNFVESPSAKKARIKLIEKKKKKKIKKMQTGPPEDGPGPAQPIRKCLHCEITKTPQWRAGPMGPKTLCNACGVRYKSGRLFPEYRPAASPTFIPAVHSNSHKKVLEMRGKGEV